MGKFKVARSQPKPKPERPRWLLPTILVVAGLAVVAVIFWLVQGRQGSVAYTAEVTGRPYAAIDQTTFDYGDVKLGSTIKTVFLVKNTGDRDLLFQGEPRVEVIEGC